MSRKTMMKKVYNLKTIEGNMMGSMISDDKFDNMVEEYMKRTDKKLIIMTKNGPKYINCEIRSITKSEVSVSCQDTETISFFDQFEEWSKVIFIFVPNADNSPRIMDIFYIPDYRVLNKTSKEA